MTTAQKIFALIDQASAKSIEVSDKIWDYAELGFQETKSAELLKTVLAAEGFSINCKLAGIPTAFSAEFGNGKPVIGLLAEYDALSGLSQMACLPRKESIVQGGNGHGCGHNLLGGGCLAAAIALKNYIQEENIPGKVVFFGCPAEENGSGKVYMARDGVFRDVDIALSWHPGDWTGIVPTSLLANIQMQYNFIGTSSHAAVSPHLGRSALDAVEIMDIGANYLREHIPADSRIHYAITDTGGISPNVVQAHASVIYLIRATTIDVAMDIRDRVNDIARGAALITGTKADIRFVKATSHFLQNVTVGREAIRAMEELGAPAFSNEDRAIAETYAKTLERPGISSTLLPILKPLMRNNPTLSKLATASLNDVILPYQPLQICAPASSDVSDVSLNCPTAMLYITTCAQGTPVHSWQMTSQGKTALAHTGMLYSGKVMALTAVRFMTNPDLVEKAWTEFCENMDGKSYLCPIPNDISYDRETE